MMLQMAEYASNRIQLELMTSVDDILVVVWIRMIPTCSDCDPVLALDIDYGQFTA